MRSLCLPVLFGTLVAGQAVSATAPAALQISTETAPAGGWAQIKIYAVKPMNIASGQLVLNLNATAFGTGAMVGLFGANGDATGSATTNGSQIEVKFSSASAGIGALAGLPVMVISVPVLASATGTVAVTATSPDSSVSVASGSVTVQGTLSVQSIPAGMGVIPAGTVVPVYGTGFTAATTVTIDGVVIASTRFVSTQEVDVSIGGATELVGKRARVREGGVEFDYFCFQPNAPLSFPPVMLVGATTVSNVQPLFPLSASTELTVGYGNDGAVFEVQNPNSSAATVSVTNVPEYSLVPQGPQTVSIPAGSWALFNGIEADGFALISSSLPVRSVSLAPCGAAPCFWQSPTPYDAAPAPVLTPSSLMFEWQMGSQSPAARTVYVTPALSFPEVVTASTTASWLSAQVIQGGLSISVNPSQLTAGTYQGSVLVTQSQAQSYGLSATLSVTLTVTNTPVPVISASPTSLAFSAANFTATPSTQTISLTSDTGPAAFSVLLQPGTLFQVSPMGGMTPATLNVTWNPAGTEQTQVPIPLSILISGPGNAISIPVTIDLTGIQAEPPWGPNGLVFAAQTGSGPQMQSVNVLGPPGIISATVNQPWISAAVSNNTAVAGSAVVTVNVNPAGLSPGNYSGTATVSEPGIPSLAVPVTLDVWATAPPLTISTASFTFVQTVGEPLPPVQTAQVNSGGVSLPLTVSSSTNWLSAVVPNSALTPTQITVGIGGQEPGMPGQYNGSFTLQTPGGSVNVPVTLLVEPGPLAPPVLSQVVNAASGIPGGVSPGEIVSLRGYGVGASAISGYMLNAEGMVESNLNGLQVTFDGEAAPLLYTSPNQANLIVPYEVAGKTSTVMQMTYAAAGGTVQTAAWVLPVVGSAPGIFTLDATGTGPGAVENEDYSVNSAANPAARGSVVSIYATGEGQTNPPGVTGSVTQSNTKMPLLPVTVMIGGVEAAVQYAGSAPDEIAGLLQVNAVVPAGVAPGPAVPVTVSVGGVVSQAGVTIAVK
jgi:uncharacterized protein (TIGR03437 family)